MLHLPIAVFVGFLLMGLAWLVPNHYWPWSSFHADAVSAIGLSVLAVTAQLSRKGAAPWPRLAIFVVIVATVPLIQAACGLIYFWGDAWIAALYLVGFALALVTGSGLARHFEAVDVLRVFWGCALVAAIASVGIALCQWTGISVSGLLVADMPPGGRPFGNLAQPNQLATLLVLGAVGATALLQQRDLGVPAWGLSMGMLILGIVMTGSRTGALEFLVFLLWIASMRGRASLLVPRRAALVLGLVFVAFMAAWPVLGNSLGLNPAIQLETRTQVGMRPTHWATMIDAIQRHPWVGYGWNQVSVAQAEVALDHPSTEEAIEHSHNIVLDLMVWNGVPLSLFFVGVLVWWFWSHVRRCKDSQTAFLLAAIGAIGLHGLLEFPLEYAYFLLPLGFMMGVVEVLSPSGRLVALPRSLGICASLVAMLFTGWVAVEYVQAEANGRLLRLESARIGTHRIESLEPDLVVLTQLREFLHFARTEARPGMTAGELMRMRRLAHRYAYAPALFRYALASGLNGRADEARTTLMLLCKVQLRDQCLEGRNAWAAMGEGQYPELKSIAWPDIPLAP